jgi:hypothetical protein
MENPIQKKRFPWGWVAAGCGAVAIVVVAVILVLVFVALPAFRNTTASQNPSLIPHPGPLIGATAVPTPGSANGTGIGSLPFTISAVQDPTTLPTQSLMDQMSSSLNLNTDTDFMAPKSYKGTATLDPTTSFTLGNAWCAKDSTTLQQNLASMQFQLSINGTAIDLSQYPTLNFTDNQGNACALTGVSITPSGTLGSSYHIVLTQRYLKSLDDGITGSPYPAGDVTFDFSIQFQSTTPHSGKGA